MAVISIELHVKYFINSSLIRLVALDDNNVVWLRNLVLNVQYIDTICIGINLERGKKNQQEAGRKEVIDKVPTEGR